jgi:hypothetical protein
VQAKFVFGWQPLAAAVEFQQLVTDANNPPMRERHDLLRTLCRKLPTDFELSEWIRRGAAS